ncbi:MAG TPA: thioredoxin domain-containing protein [Kofleriaceae bacterium]
MTTKHKAPDGQLTLPVGARDHIAGSNQAPITLVEYGDYQCPYCGQAYPIVKAVRAKLGKRLRFVFRNFPLVNAHPHAEAAAESAEAASAQGRFWEMHDMLFENQRALAYDDLVVYATNVGLDVKRFASDLDKRAYLPRVREDVASGADSGVHGTPSFFINGVRFEGSWDEHSLLAALTER